MTIPEHIEHGMDNLLGLDDLNSTLCHVVEMVSNDAFTRLAIILEGLVADAYVTFEDAQYFDGSIWWWGASIRTASLVERDAFVERVNLKGLNPEDCFLFEFTAENSTIHVIAKDIHYTEARQSEQQLEDAELIKRIDTGQSGGEPMIVKSYHFRGKTDHQSNPVDYVLRLFQKGHSFDEILHTISLLEPEDIQACLAYARHKLK